ncbi:hypothetical protein L195_g031551, partial [Trifolium pratense]
RVPPAATLFFLWLPQPPPSNISLPLPHITRVTTALLLSTRIAFPLITPTDPSKM